MIEKRINIMEPEIPTLQQPPAEEPAEKKQVEYASVTERFVALLIDYGVVFIPAQLIARVILNIMGPITELWQIASIFIGINLLFILYETILSSGDRVTLGKALVGIAVVKKDLSGPISLPRAFLRAIGYYFSAALLMCGFLLAFFDDKHRALQDFLGGSVVVQIREKTWMERTMVRLLGGVLLVAFAATSYTQFFGRGGTLQQFYIRRAQEHLGKIALLEEAHYNRYGSYTNDLLRLSLLSGDPVQFQRDTQKVLYPKGFKIGVQGNYYKISARARDARNTPVYFTSK
ncbi:RDD family protein [Candidatus Avelusimicrobium gallicola]|uniref:RDD domain-containing protein n=1 Tax=Candidatus Avelusimicrobium gallicola TaxID=2562704 RepID=A0A1Y4DET2_9BACT|nr:RDD family protein [Elusimicrobium sp. An273]OUO57415.1 hypothetical protein B5F75_01185 [Elusimicrobium sp. An273]